MINTYLLGDSAVGKTAVAQSFISDGSQFPKLYQMVKIKRE